MERRSLRAAQIRRLPRQLGGHRYGHGRAAGEAELHRSVGQRRVRLGARRIPEWCAMTYSAHLLPPDVRPTARDYPGLSGPDTIWVDERWWRFTAHTDLHTVRYLDVRQSGRSVALAMLLITPRPGGLLFYDPPRLAGTPGALAEPELLDPSGRQRWDELTVSLPGADQYPSLALATFGNHHGVAHAPDRTADQRSAVM